MVIIRDKHENLQREIKKREEKKLVLGGWTTEEKPVGKFVL